MNSSRLPKTMHLTIVCLSAVMIGTGSMTRTRASEARPDGSIFVRVAVKKTDIYVGESVPVDIQVGARDDVVASLDSPPSLKGDAFTLDVLTGEPDREQRVIDGEPCTVLVWHSLLAAVKSGKLSLTVEAPMTVRVPNPDARETVFADEAAADPYSDPPFQTLMQSTVAEPFVASSEPLQFAVLPLPMEDRPANFSGAVGNFTISTELSRARTVVGEPLTLRMRVLGAGNFDRVNSAMVVDATDWKVYRPTASFKSSGESAYRGEKLFEQVVVATAPGTHDVPGLEFSYFDPETRRYAIARAPPLAVDVAANAAPLSAHSAPTSVMSQVAGLVLHGDHVDLGASADSLLPLYLQSRFLGMPIAVICGLTGVWFVRRHRDPRWRTARSGRARDPTDELLLEMQRSAASGDAAAFFRCVRRALSDGCAASLDAEVRDVLMLADETAYAGVMPAAAELHRCNRIIARFLASRPQPPARAALQA